MRAPSQLKALVRFAEPTAVLQVQRQAYAQTIEHDLRRSHVAFPVSRLFNKAPLALDKRTTFSDALFRF